MGDTNVTGRQILWMSMDWYRVVEADGCIFDFTHLNSVKLQDRDLSGFLQVWDHTLSGMKSIPESGILLSLFKAQVEKHRGMDVDMGEFNRMEPEDTRKSYEWLYDRCVKLLARQRLSAARTELETGGDKGGGRFAFPVRKGVCLDWLKRGKCDVQDCPWVGRGVARG